jgi:hypothetical protein
MADVRAVSQRLRVEVADRHGTTVAIAEPGHRLPPRQRKQASALAAGLTGGIARILGSGEDHARWVAVAVLMRLMADEAAYERVAERRGVLPL